MFYLKQVEDNEHLRISKYDPGVVLNEDLFLG